MHFLSPPLPRRNTEQRNEVSDGSSSKSYPWLSQFFRFHKLRMGRKFTEWYSGVATKYRFNFDKAFKRTLHKAHINAVCKISLPEASDISFYVPISLLKFPL
jgi:hypothetical protein